MSQCVKVLTTQALQSEFNFWNHVKVEEESWLKSCPLTSTCVSQLLSVASLNSCSFLSQTISRSLRTAWSDLARVQVLLLFLCISYFSCYCNKIPVKINLRREDLAKSLKVQSIMGRCLATLYLHKEEGGAGFIHLWMLLPTFRVGLPILF